MFSNINLRRIVSFKWVLVKVFVLVMSVAGSADAAVYFNNNGGDGFWNNGANWHTGNVPLASDDVRIYAAGQDCIVNTQTNITNVDVGYNTAGQILVKSGGALTINSILRIGRTADAIFKMESGAGLVYVAGDARLANYAGADNCLLEINGGVFSVNKLYVPLITSTVSAKINLFGGKLEIRDPDTFSLLLNYNGAVGQGIEMKDGTIIEWAGNRISALENETSGYLPRGLIYTNDPACELVVDYNLMENVTTVSCQAVSYKHTVIVGENADNSVESLAYTVAGILSSITGVEHDVVIGDGTVGIAIGKASDFPVLGLSAELPIMRETRDKYIIRSHDDGIYLVGSTDTAAQHAVWDYLYRLGYRQFFPTQQWEYIPSLTDAKIDVNETVVPDYLNRRITYVGGGWTSEMTDNYENWLAKNRVNSGFDVWVSHSWNKIISDNQSEFDAHPEYYALCDGSRDTSGNKFCISNQGLRDLVRDWAIDYLYDNPDADTVSLSPSDGGGFCECASCAALGSITDQVMYLTNYVADAIAADFNLDGKYVCVYAYSYHSQPPSSDVADNVLVQATTLYIRDGFTYPEILAGWGAKNAKLGVREYFNLTSFGNSPFSALAANTEYVSRTIPEFYTYGAFNSYNSESSDDWGPSGLGYYIASRLLWDVNESPYQIKQDFFDKMFDDPNSSTVRAKITEFYDTIDGYNQPLFSEHLIGKLYRLMQDARGAVTVSAIKDRIDSLVLLTRYFELYRNYHDEYSNTGARQAAFELLIRHAYRMGEYMMINSRGLYRYLDIYDTMVSIPEGSQWDDPEATNPWKDSTPFSDTEIANFIANGVSSYSLFNVDVTDYSSKLVSAGPLNLADVSRGSNGLYERSQQPWTYYVLVTDESQMVDFDVEAGIVYEDRGQTRFELYHTNMPGTLVDSDTILADGGTGSISLDPVEKGLHKVIITDFYAGTDISWHGFRSVVESSRYEPVVFQGRWTMYFYVPKGTTEIRCYVGRTAEFYDGGETQRLLVEDAPDFYIITVPSGQDGKLWQVRNALEEVRLLNIPPYFSINEDNLLLPKELMYLNSDLNLDFYVDQKDLGLLTQQWLQVGCEFDLDGDCFVDLNDLAELANQWMECLELESGNVCN